MTTKKKRFIKYLIVGVMFVLVIGAKFFSEITETSEAETNQTEDAAHIPLKPTHTVPFKLGMETDVKMAIQNYSRVKQVEKEKRLAAAQEKQLAKQKAKEVAKKELAEKEKTQAKVKETQENLQNSSQENTQEVSSNKLDNPVSAANSSSKPVPSSQSANTQQAISTPKVSSLSTSKTKAPAYENYQIGVNGIFHSYSNYGRASTNQLQAGIDAGLIVAGYTHFNGNDGETTYFGGHNPGIMRFMGNNLFVGAVVTVTNGNGQAFNYKMIDKVDVDEYGEGMLHSIGMSAITAYTYGTGSESILIQFCNIRNNLMSFWYGIPM